MSLIFTRTIRIPDANGVLTDADATPTISIVRTDTSATVLATTSTGITHPSTGKYQYTLASPVAGVTYRATWTFLIGGQTIEAPSEKTATAGSDGDWYYSGQQQVIDASGIPNRDIVFDLDDDGNVDSGAVYRAGTVADAYINLKLRKARLTAPYDKSDATITLNLQQANTLLTIFNGFIKRGLPELDENVRRGIAGQMNGYKKAADLLIDDVIAVLSAADETDEAEPAGTFTSVPIVDSSESCAAWDENASCT